MNYDGSDFMDYLSRKGVYRDLPNAWFSCHFWLPDEESLFKREPRLVVVKDETELVTVDFANKRVISRETI